MTASTAAAADPRLANDALLREDLSARRAKPRSVPSVLRLETSTACELRCLHCFQQVREPRTEQTMSAALYERIADELFPRVRVLEFAFDGEPLADPSFGERLLRIPLGGPRIDLLTSGRGLRRFLPDLLPRLCRLTISLEAVDDVLYPMVRKGARLPEFIEEVESAADAIAGMAADVRPELEFRVVVFQGNHERLPGIVARLARFGAKSVHLAYGVTLRGHHPDLGPPRDPRQLEISLQRAVLQGSVLGTSVTYPSLVPAATVESPANGGFSASGHLPWHFPWTHATIDGNGLVSLCCPRRLLGGAPSVLWNPERPFEDAWTSVPFQAARRNSPSPECCGFCPHGQGVADG